MAIYVSDLFSTPVHFSDRNLAHRDQELRCKVYTDSKQQNPSRCQGVINAS